MTNSKAGIPSGTAAVWGAYLYEGLFTANADPQRGTAVNKAWGKGNVELVTHCSCTYLPEVWRQASDRLQCADLPGVFEYEVISELGTVLGDHLIINQKLPDDDKAPDIVRVLVEDFFNRQDVPASKPETSTADPQIKESGLLSDLPRFLWSGDSK